MRHGRSSLSCIMVTVGGALSSVADVVVAVVVFVLHLSVMVAWSSLVPPGCGPLLSMKDDNICHRHLSEEGGGEGCILTSYQLLQRKLTLTPSHPPPPLAATSLLMQSSPMHAAYCPGSLSCGPQSDDTNNELVVVRRLVATSLLATWHLCCL